MKNPFGKKQKPSARTQLSVDFPRQGEKISSADYTFRISAPGDVQKIEVCVDQGGWQPCRNSAGYWWYDWSDYEEGEHEITARLATADGKTASGEPHEFFVQLEKQPA